MVDQLVGDLGRPGGDPPVRTAPATWGTGQVTVRHRPTEQAHVLVGGPALASQDPRRHTLRVLNTLLGGGMSSRLFQEIRETRGLAYTIFSYASGYSDAGLYGAYAGATPRKIDEVLAVMTAELDGLADSVTADEVERAKGSLKGGMVLGLEDTGSRMSRIGKAVCTGAELVTVDEVTARIDAVILDAVGEVAHDVLSGPRALAVVGPYAEDDTDRFAAYVA